MAKGLGCALGLGQGAKANKFITFGVPEGRASAQGEAKLWELVHFIGPQIHEASVEHCSALCH